MKDTILLIIAVICALIALFASIQGNLTTQYRKSHSRYEDTKEENRLYRAEEIDIVSQPDTLQDSTKRDTNHLF